MPWLARVGQNLRRAFPAAQEQRPGRVVERLGSRPADIAGARRPDEAEHLVRALLYVGPADEGGLDGLGGGVDSGGGLAAFLGELVEDRGEVLGGEPLDVGPSVPGRPLGAGAALRPRRGCLDAGAGELLLGLPTLRRADAFIQRGAVLEVGDPVRRDGDSLAGRTLFALNLGDPPGQPFLAFG